MVNFEQVPLRIIRQVLATALITTERSARSMPVSEPELRVTANSFSPLINGFQPSCSSSHDTFLSLLTDDVVNGKSATLIFADEVILSC